MSQSFLLHIENETTMNIPCEEIMFLSSLKANRLSDYCEELFIIQVTLTNNSPKKNCRVKTIVKIKTNNGEFTAYSYGNRWEESLTKGFENIIHLLILQQRSPVQQQPMYKENETVLHLFSEN